MSKWISVEKQLPEPFEKVLVNFKKDGVKNMQFVAYIDNNEEWGLIYLYEVFPVIKNRLTPTHWMPLPEPPDKV